MRPTQEERIAALMQELEETNAVRERHRLDIIEKLETIIKLQKILGEIGTTTDQITEGILRVKRGEEYVE